MQQICNILPGNRSRNQKRSLVKKIKMAAAFI